jgi:hypothetical protein
MLDDVSEERAAQQRRCARRAMSVVSDHCDGDFESVLGLAREGVNSSAAIGGWKSSLVLDAAKCSAGTRRRSTWTGKPMSPRASADRAHHLRRDVPRRAQLRRKDGTTFWCRLSGPRNRRIGAVAGHGVDFDET